MGKPISAEEHNAARREAKAKQRANARAKAGNRATVGSGSVLLDAKKERRNRETWKQKSEENGRKLLAKVDEQKVLRLPVENARDISDVKRAAKASVNRYVWDYTSTGFVITRKPAHGSE